MASAAFVGLGAMGARIAARSSCADAAASELGGRDHSAVPARILPDGSRRGGP